MSMLSRYGWFCLILAGLLLFLIWPILLSVRGGFITPDGRLTVNHLLDFSHDRLAVEALVNSLLIAVCTTALSFVLALPLSILASRYEFRGKALLTALVLTPLILPPFVGAIGLRAMLGRFGAVNSLLGAVGILDANQPGVDFLGGSALGGPFWAVVVMEALHLYPVLYLNMLAALANVDPTLEEAALNLGAGRWRRFWRITTPLMAPGVFAGATIVFIWSFTELGAPLMFDYHQVLPVQIFWGIQEIEVSPRPYVLVIVMLAVALSLYLLGKRAFGGRSHEMKSKASIASTARRLSGVKAFGAVCVFLLIGLIAVLPHLGVVFVSLSAQGSWYRSVLPTDWTLSHYRGALTHELTLSSIHNSLLYATLAMALCVTIGLAISHLHVRAKIRGGWLLDALAMLPLAVPGLVIAFGYVAMSLGWPFAPLAETFEARGWSTLAGWCRVTGSAPDPLVFLVIAYAVRRLPYIVRSASAGLEQTAGELEQAARNLGASAWTTLRRIVLPLIMANLIAGAILVFAFAMLEVSDSLILAQKQTHYPMTKAIYSLFNRLGDGPYLASAMGVWGMLLLTVTLLGAGSLLGKRLGAIFRV